MLQYPNCPKCSNIGLSIIDKEVNEQRMKGVQCIHCNELLWIYQDTSTIIEELKDMIENIESRADDLEGDLSRIH